MKELLSADELNNLLTAVSEGQVATAPAAVPGRRRQVQPYDFRRSDRLSREQLRAIQDLHRGVAGAISCILSDLLHAPVDVNVMATEITTYAAFNAAAPDPACLQAFHTRPGGHRGLLTLEIPLASRLIDRLLGGQGEALAQHRSLTELEKAVITPLLHTLLGKFAAAWSAHTRVEFAPGEVAMSPRDVQILGGPEIVLQVSLAVAGEACVGDLSLCLPFAAVRELIPRGCAAEPDDTPAEARELLARAVGAAPVRVAVELGRAQISVLELLNLRPGHVVRLDSRFGRPLAVTVEGSPQLAGQPGLVGARRGIRITDTPSTNQQGS